MKPERNPALLKFVRSLPCCICGKLWRIDAAHTGPHGMGQKSPDSSCIPLCRYHHSDSNVGLDRIGRAAFEDLHGISVAALVKLTQSRAAACGVPATYNFRADRMPGSNPKGDPNPKRNGLEKKPISRVMAISGLRGSRLAR